MSIRVVSANGLNLPALGQGGWHIGDAPDKAQIEMAALQTGMDLGLTLIDTAEMYGEGKSERLIGGMLAGRKRGECQLVSKVYPHNAGRGRMDASCDASLKRLRTDYLDLYLLHWRGSVPLAETVACMQALVKSGKIRRWGVSNFDTADMEELWAIPDGPNCAVNQVLYHLGSRGIEYDLIPWLRAHQVAVMAYCPLAQGGSLQRAGQGYQRVQTLTAVAAKYGITVMQLMLGFVLRQDHVIAIPKAGSPAHVRENAAILDVSISPDDWATVDRAYPPPAGKMPLDII
ncbi:MAG: aldo/keto reductase [Oscillospiraceae bacterium]|nr:aldo/keto reductase [Oscillospiraceae bacterium]